MADIFAEVEEDVRRENFKKLWDRYGKYATVAAIVLVAAVGGFTWWKQDRERRAEVASLTLADWDADKCQVIVQKGKGNKSREIPLPDGACRAVMAWLGRRGAASASDPLICPLAKGDKIENRQMSTQAIWKAIQKRALKSGIASFSPHDCRRTYIGDLLEHGADLSTVQKLAGHADPKMTAHYDRRPAEVRRAAVKGLHIPFI